ncbi:hypothetical protein SAMN05216199_0021 [Pedococcus cremeus]|uniref:Uncharacterized protein n=1 Tax=Pedococcus cremeus TaxID=587636 RepID=A0A1H9XPC8_9MICO|nr:hypothetical protein SAMN05216199_0021 [Pedococcus cremeus]
MAVEKYGLRCQPPRGWRLAIERKASVAAGVPHGLSPAMRGQALERVEPNGEVMRPILHACTIDLPSDRGDFGSGVVDLLGSEDVFISLVEYGSEVADQGLFAEQGMPRLAPSQFGPNRLQRPLPGRSASQHFFSVGGRAFCLFTVIGSHSRRMATVPRAAEVVRGLHVTDRRTLVRQGEMT